MIGSEPGPLEAFNQQLLHECHLDILSREDEINVPGLPVSLKVIPLKENLLSVLFQRNYLKDGEQLQNTLPLLCSILLAQISLKNEKCI